MSINLRSRAGSQFGRPYHHSRQLRNFLNELGERHTAEAHRVYYEALERPGHNEEDLVWRIDYGRLVSQLPEEQRCLMRWVALGYTQGEIAELCGCSLRKIVRQCGLYGIVCPKGRCALGKKAGRPKKVRSLPQNGTPAGKTGSAGFTLEELSH